MFEDCHHLDRYWFVETATKYENIHTKIKGIFEFKLQMEVTRIHEQGLKDEISNINFKSTKT